MLKNQKLESRLFVLLWIVVGLAGVAVMFLQERYDPAVKDYQVRVAAQTEMLQANNPAVSVAATAPKTVPAQQRHTEAVAYVDYRVR